MLHLGFKYCFKNAYTTSEFKAKCYLTQPEQAYTYVSAAEMNWSALKASRNTCNECMTETVPGAVTIYFK